MASNFRVHYVLHLLVRAFFGVAHGMNNEKFSEGRSLCLAERICSLEMSSGETHANASNRFLSTAPCPGWSGERQLDGQRNGCLKDKVRLHVEGLFAALTPPASLMSLLCSALCHCHDVGI
jgi:hypothetical protein